MDYKNGTASDIYFLTPDGTHGTIPAGMTTSAKDDFEVFETEAEMVERYEGLTGKVYPVPETEEELPPPVVIVPQEISSLQGLLAIDQFGLAEIYTQWAANPARTFSEKAFIDKAQTWKRDNVVLLSAAESFGLTPEQVDQMFIVGVKL